MQGVRLFLQRKIREKKIPYTPAKTIPAGPWYRCPRLKDKVASVIVSHQFLT
jgi:hypothetical protein